MISELKNISGGSKNEKSKEFVKTYIDKAWRKGAMSNQASSRKVSAVSRLIG